jgi:TATA-binding protein-associated factor
MMADMSLSTSDQVGQDVLDTFTTLSTVVAHLHPDLHPRIITTFPHLLIALQSGFAVIRQAASRAISAICDVATVDGMRNVVEEVLPFLGDPTTAKRQGAVEVIANIVRTLDVKALPYVLFMIVPILGRMSDSDDDARLLATSTFASLVKMVPLEVSPESLYARTV